MKAAVSTFLCIDRCGDKGRSNDILYSKTETLYFLSIFFLRKFKKNPKFIEKKGNFKNVHKSVDRLDFNNKIPLKYKKILSKSSSIS